MKIKFLADSKISAVNFTRLNQINEVIEDYALQGYKLTLRQLYYQLVSKNIIANSLKEYAKLGNLLTKGRMMGIVDWDAIEDRVRVPRHVYCNSSVEDAINNAESIYRLDRMDDQDNYIELWVEKDAISNILQSKTRYYHVRLMVNRGYSSTTAMYDAYNRFLPILEAGKSVNVLYLGDHDPSGLDMVRDIQVRLFRMLAAQPRAIIDFVDNLVDTSSDEFVERLEEKYGDNPLVYDGEDDSTEINLVKAWILDNFHIQHIGLTTKQVKQYNPPPNPAKLKDPRAKWYIKEFGKTCWEVDALTPPIFHQIIDTAILALIDKDKFDAKLQQEDVDKVILRDLPRLRVDHAILEHKVGELDAENTQMAEDVALLEGTINEVRGVAIKLKSPRSYKTGETSSKIAADYINAIDKIKAIIS